MTRLRAILVVVVSFALAGCLLMPGRFDSTLDLRRDGTFQFHYAGELVFLPLTDAARSQMAKGAVNKPAEADGGPTADQAPNADQAEVFTEETCTRTDTGEARACTAEDIAAQRRAYEARKRAPAPSSQLAGANARSAANARSNANARSTANGGADAMLSMLGGMNASDPRAPAVLAEALRRQAGWRKVEYRGNGVFMVEYDAAGRLDHDFTFPTIEHMPMIMPLVTVMRHADGAVRIDAPGFAPGLANLGALGAMIPGQARNSAGGAPMKGMPPMDGTLTVTTDGTILANNTEDGPGGTGPARTLTWHVSTGHAVAPTALIRAN